VSPIGFYNFTENVRRALGQARHEAVALNREYVGTEHLLLGLLRERKGLAADVLLSQGVTLESARGEVIAILEREAPSS
jgi:ATP-dependent Clp protease ATP-binding subunit ClpC